MALAGASSDIAVNTVTAVQGAGQIGLGNLLGSNVVSIPLVVTAAYLASRKRELGDQDGGGGSGQHVDQGLIRIEPGSVTVVALPYRALVLLFVPLTPAGYTGLVHGGRGQGLQGRQVLVLLGVLLAMGSS